MRRFALVALLVIGLAGCGKAAVPQSQALPPVPTPAAPSPSASPTPTPEQQQTVCEIGQFQLAVETALAHMGTYGPVTVDGVQSDADCAAIKGFQTRFGLEPVDGVAGADTNGVAQRLAATDPAQCAAAGSGTTACVDLTHQTTWLMRDGAMIYGPTVTRTGMKDHVTPTGSYQIDYRALKDWSKPYRVWLPYWQSFNYDIGFHQTTTYIHDADLGSHGCVNLLPEDAVGYWNQLAEGSAVHVFGHRAGT